MTVVLTLNAEPLWLQAIQQQALPTVATLAELTQTQTPVIVNTPVTLAQLTELIAQYPKVLLAYTAPEQEIAALLTQGLTLTAAAAQWQQQVQALLALHRQWRSKLVLVNLSQLSYCHTNDLNILAEAGWPLTKPLVAPTAQFYTVIAAQLLQQQPELSALYQLLKASSIAITEQLPPCNLDTILQQYQSDLSEKKLTNLQFTALVQEQTTLNAEKVQLQTQLQEVQNALDKTVAEHQSKQQVQQALKAENELLLTQLMQTQEELEKQFLTAQQLEQQLQQSKQQFINFQQQHQAELQKYTVNAQQLEQQLAQRAQQAIKLEQQHNLVKTQMLEIKTESDTALQKLMQVQELLQGEVETNHQLQQHLKQGEEQQRAWQIKYAQSQQENNEIISELMVLQEKLEEYYLQLDKNKHDAISRDKQQKRELTRVQSQLRKAKARADEAEFKLKNLQQDVKGIQNSKAWKVAAPVRALSRLIHKEDKTKKQIQRDVALIITSELFDTEWYTRAYPDVASGSINPAEHYLRFGAAEGRRPGPDFDGSWYLQRYPDVAETGINPLLHFVKFGRSEGRTASPKLLEDHREQGEG